MFSFLKSIQKEEFFIHIIVYFLKKIFGTQEGVKVNFRSGLLHFRDRRLRILKSVLKGQSHEKVFKFLTWDGSYSLN
jgi:hypothetical protein